MYKTIVKIALLVPFTMILSGCPSTTPEWDGAKRLESCRSYGTRPPEDNCHGAKKPRPQLITVTANSISVQHEPLDACPGDTIEFTADPPSTEFAILFNRSEWPGKAVGPNSLWSRSGKLDIKVKNPLTRGCVGYSVIVKDKAAKTVRGLDPVLIIDY